jgi:transposase-like protein
MPKAECPHCSTRHDVPAELAGRRAKCYRCRKSFSIAFEPESEPEAFEATPDIDDGLETMSPQPPPIT